MISDAALEAWAQRGIATIDHGPAPLSPEMCLFHAILESWFLDWQCNYKRRHTARGLRLFEEDEAWFLSDDRTWPMSFLNVCEATGVNPESLRKRIAELRSSSTVGIQRLGPRGEVLPVGVQWRRDTDKHPFRVVRHKNKRYFTQHYATLEEALEAHEAWQLAS